MVAFKAPVGRPRIDPLERKTPICVSLKARQLKKLRALASNSSISMVVSRAVDEYLAKAHV